MRTTLLSVFLGLCLCLPFLSVTPAGAQFQTIRGASAPRIPAPQDVLGFTPGDDRKLASWNQVVDYFEKLDQASDRVMFKVLGKSTMDLPFVMATISAPENLSKLDDYINIQRRLADPRQLGAERRRDRNARSLIARGKTIVLITCGIHSTEVGSYLSSMLIAHRLASSNDPEVLNILKNTIVLLVPSLNPDGVDIVKNWYDKTLGTPYEGTSPPELYHKYIGHDNNRDWYAFTQVETKITVDKIHNVWRPQIVHDIHQQGEYGSRLFLPPYMAPVEPNVPKQIIEGYTELGNWMAAEMRRNGFKGITTGSTYDAWTPARAYSHYHGGVRILSETASARIASPLTVKFEQLRSREGYDPQKESERFGPLWRGGEWKLRDITNYMTAGAFTLLGHAANNRERWLTRFYEIGKDAVRTRQAGELYGFALPPSQNLRHLTDILYRGGVELDVAKPFASRGIAYPHGTMIVPMAQPYGRFAKTLLEAQKYPHLTDSAGYPQAPYDVTAHTLPLLMNVNAAPLNAPFRYRRARPIIKSYGPAGGRVQWKLAIYRSNVPSMDEGWTRWTLSNQSMFVYGSVGDREIRLGHLYDKFRIIVLPDQTPRAIFQGNRQGLLPAEYTGGLGQEGVTALREFVAEGGTLVCLNRSSEFAIEYFKLPIKNVVHGVPEKQFFVPGSILRIELDTTHPIAAHMPRESIAWVEDSPVFEVDEKRTAGPQQSGNGNSEVKDVRVIARYPAAGNPLLSGWLLGAERLRGKAALVEVKVGKGRVILFGFRPQYRGQSLATYPLFFNALRW